MRRVLTRVHLWLGWLVGVPLLFWTVSGLWMVARPIDKVRGTALRATALPIVAGDKQFPKLGGDRATSLVLEQQPGGSRWIVTLADGQIQGWNADTGDRIHRVAVTEARQIARQSYLGKSAIESARFFSQSEVPIDLRKPRPSWQVRFADGANLYVDAETGQVLALRTRQWRAYDWMWGLHIMDLQRRENTSHLLLIVFAALAAGGTLIALVLLPIASRRRR